MTDEEILEQHDKYRLVKGRALTAAFARESTFDNIGRIFNPLNESTKYFKMECTKCSHISVVRSDQLRRLKRCSMCEHLAEEEYFANGIKKCSQCNTEKPFDSFGSDSKSPDNLRQACNECRNKNRRDWNRDNRDKINEGARILRAENRDRYREYSIKYTRQVRLATPTWLTKQHKETIREIYEHSKEMTLSTGIKHEVDHIIPINGNGVCGLHVPWNLQVITRTDNRKKHNSY